MAQESSTNETREKKVDTNNYKRIAGYLAPYKKLVVALFFVVLFSNILNIVGPYLTSIVIDFVIPHNNVPLLVFIIVAYIIVQLVKGWTIRYRQ